MIQITSRIIGLVTFHLSLMAITIDIEFTFYVCEKRARHRCKVHLGARRNEVQVWSLEKAAGVRRLRKGVVQVHDVRFWDRGAELRASLKSDEIRSIFFSGHHRNINSFCLVQTICCCIPNQAKPIYGIQLFGHENLSQLKVSANNPSDAQMVRTSMFYSSHFFFLLQNWNFVKVNCGQILNMCNRQER